METIQASPDQRPEPKYDENHECAYCGAHISDPHDPSCPLADADLDEEVDEQPLEIAPDRELEWRRLMSEALTMSGSMSSVYCRFYNYSHMNQLLIYLQGVREPVNTYDRWKAMGRQVQKGSKAKAILRPILGKERNQDTGELEQVLRGFKMVRCLFGASETEGDELPEYQPAEWDVNRALGALAISRQPFQLLAGNTQGYSCARKVAVSPVAAEPLPTLVHIEHGHTTPAKLGSYATHRGLMEFEAESTAYLVLSDPGVEEPHWNKAESRGYIQGWLRGTQRPSDEQIKGVFKVTDRVLLAGRPAADASA